MPCFIMMVKASAGIAKAAGAVADSVQAVRFPEDATSSKPRPYDSVYDLAEFSDNPEARCPIVLVLDTSMYMGGPNYTTMQQALSKFREIIREDPVTSLRADIAVVTFDENFRLSQDFTNGRDFAPPGIQGFGASFYAGAINLALDMIEYRKRGYRDTGIAHYRGLVFFLACGPPQDHKDELDAVSRRLARAENDRSVAFFAFVLSATSSLDEYDPEYLDGLAEHMPNYQDELAAMSERWDAETLDALDKLSPRPPVVLTNLTQLENSIQWLSQSVTAISQSQPGETVRLPQPTILSR